MRSRRLNRAIAALDSAIAALEAPLQQADRANGWNEERMRMFLEWMQDLKVRSQFPGYLKQDTRSICRNLDMLGIHDGRLYELVSEVASVWN